MFSVYCILCTVYCSVCCILCFVYCVLCIVYCVLTFGRHAWENVLALSLAQGGASSDPRCGARRLRQTARCKSFGKSSYIYIYIIIFLLGPKGCLRYAVALWRPFCIAVLQGLRPRRAAAPRSLGGPSRGGRAASPLGVAALWEVSFKFLRVGNRSCWGSGRPRGPGRPFHWVGGFAHHLLEGSQGPPGPPRPPK